MTALEGRIAVVTGASSGIGAACARALADAGATIVAVARRKDRLAALTAELGRGSLPFVIDMTQPDAAQALHDFVMERFERADILVNNAGILHAAPLDAFDLDQLRPMIALNYETVVRTSTLFGRTMKAAGRGQIINCLRIELAGTGVKVGIVAPGTTSTEIFEDMKSRGQPSWDSFIPPMQPDDVAQAVSFMAQQSQRTNMARIQIYAAADSH